MPEYRYAADGTRLYDCPKCLDDGLIEIEYVSRLVPGATYRGSQPCQTCAEGLRWEAGFWYDVVFPASKFGKRHFSMSGKTRMVQHYGSRIRRLAAVEAKMDDFQQSDTGDHKKQSEEA